MEFGSIRRKNRISTTRRKTFISSNSNLSCISCNTASVVRKTLCVTLPKDFGCEVHVDGKVVKVRRGGPAHAVGIIQIGDYLRMIEEEEDGEEDLIKLQVTYGVLQVDSRPECPLVIEIGNRSHTSLGIALTDTPDSRIEISSIQPGSLAERCGFLTPGDILTSICLNPLEENVPCTPFYNSFQIAQILRQLTNRDGRVKITIVPGRGENNRKFTILMRPNSVEEEEEEEESNGSNSNSNSNSTLMTTPDSQGFGGFGLGILNRFMNTTSNKTFRTSTTPTDTTTVNMNMGTLLRLQNKPIPSMRQIEKLDEEQEEQGESGTLLSLCLWKDPLYEDWGFSLVDDNSSGGATDADETDVEQEEHPEELDNLNVLEMKLLRRRGVKSQGAVVYEIRAGGPAAAAGLRHDDRIMEINGRDVSKLESTMLVPILASLENAMNLLVLRDSSDCNINSNR